MLTLCEVISQAVIMIIHMFEHGFAYLQLQPRRNCHLFIHTVPSDLMDPEDFIEGVLITKVNWTEKLVRPSTEKNHALIKWSYRLQLKAGLLSVVLQLSASYWCYRDMSHLHLNGKWWIQNESSANFESTICHWAVNDSCLCNTNRKPLAVTRLREDQR